MFPAVVLSALLQVATLQETPTVSFAGLVNTHVREILARGYAQSLNWDDLYHGHILIPKNDVTCYESMDDLLARTALILYHTAERNCRWQHEDAPIEQKTPRSIIGFLDGSIQPAIDVVGRENLKSDIRYSSYGSVGIGDVTHVRPDLYHGNTVGDVTCVMVNGKERPTSFEFYIGPDGKVTFGRE